MKCPDKRVGEWLVGREQYVLLHSIYTEYEHNRGPRPSGFAYIEAELYPLAFDQIQPQPDLLVITPSERFWKKRSADERVSQSDSQLEGQIDAFMPILLKGIRAGAEDALRNDQVQVANRVALRIIHMTIDSVYSTKKAFYFAAKGAVANALAEAIEKKFLVCGSLKDQPS